MDTTLVVVLAIAAVALLVLYLMRSRFRTAPAAAVDRAPATPLPAPAPATPLPTPGPEPALEASGRGPIRQIVFVCDAGTGSSAMGAAVLRTKVRSAGYGSVEVVHRAIGELRDDVDLVVSHADLTARARQASPSALHIGVDNLMTSPRYDDVVALLNNTNGPETPAETAAASADPAVEVEEAENAVLKLRSIELNGKATSRDEAISEAGRLLVASGSVAEGYIQSMRDREKSVSTYMGNLLAIPHGTNEAKNLIRSSAISIVRYPEVINWNGNPVKFVIGIAGAGSDHLELLGKIAEVFLDEDQIAGLEQATSATEVLDALAKVNN
jgi:PTS system mannitol-specific IIC component